MCRVIEEMQREEREEAFLEGYKEAFKEGYKEGYEEGRREAMNAIALRMLEAGKYALEEIVAISGLSLEEVKSFK